MDIKLLKSTEESYSTSPKKIFFLCFFKWLCKSKKWCCKYCQLCTSFVLGSCTYIHDHFSIEKTRSAHYNNYYYYYGMWHEYEYIMEMCRRSKLKSLVWTQRKRRKNLSFVPCRSTPAKVKYYIFRQTT